jgi:hypothetical protein
MNRYTIKYSCTKFGVFFQFAWFLTLIGWTIFSLTRPKFSTIQAWAYVTPCFALDFWESLGPMLFLIMLLNRRISMVGLTFQSLISIDSQIHPDGDQSL